MRELSRVLESSPAVYLAPLSPHQGPHLQPMFTTCSLQGPGETERALAWERKRKWNHTGDQQRGPAGADHSPIGTPGSQILLVRPRKRDKHRWSSDTSLAPTPQPALPTLHPVPFKSPRWFLLKSAHTWSGPSGTMCLVLGGIPAL